MARIPKKTAPKPETIIAVNKINGVRSVFLKSSWEKLIKEDPEWLQVLEEAPTANQEEITEDIEVEVPPEVEAISEEEHTDTEQKDTNQETT